MRKLRKLGACAVALLLLATIGCDKYEPPVPSGSDSPVFYAVGMVNGDEFEYKVDGEKFNATSQTVKDSLGVNMHEGAIVDASCADINCAPALRLNFRGSDGLASDVSSKAYPFRRETNGLTKEEYEIVLSPSALGNPIKCTWILADDEYTTAGLEALNLVRTSDDETFFEVQLIGEFENGCSSSITNMVYLPHHGCDAGIIVQELDTATHLLFSARPKSDAAYSWTFESGVTSSSQQIEYRFNTPPVDGVEYVELKVTTLSCDAKRNANVLLDAEFAECNINFSYEIETRELDNESSDDDLNLNTVEVTWVDADGKEYKSQDVDQPEWARFEVLDDADYTEPLLGSDPYSKKIQVEFDALLRAADGSIIDLRGVQLVMPVGVYQ